MVTRERRLLNVIDRLYATAVGEETWPGALKCLGDFFGGAGAGIIDLDRDSVPTGRWAAYGFDAGQVGDITRLAPINPRMSFSSREPVGHVAWERRFITEKGMERSDFYRALDRISGFRYFLGSRLEELDSVSTYTALHFSAKHGHPSPKEIELYGLLTKHIRHAWRLGPRDAASRPDETLPAFLTERLPWGIVTFGRDGKVLSINAVAEHLIAGRDGLGLEQGELIARKSAENRTLRHLIGRAVKASETGSPAGSGAMTVARPSGEPGYVVEIFPHIRDRGSAYAGTAAVVFISDPVDCRAVASQQLTEIFGLSKKETVLANLLSSNVALPEAARRMQISHNTARNHLQSIFRKTSTSTQSALVRLLSQLISRDTDQPAGPM